MGPSSVLKNQNRQKLDEEDGEDVPQQEDEPEEELVLNLEGQGIMVYDRSSGGESHVRYSMLLTFTY